MDWLTSWMSNLIVFLLAAFLLEMLLPASSLQKYARLVLSFILMLIIIEPLLSLTNGQVEDIWDQELANLNFQPIQSASIESNMNNKKNEIEEGQDAYISKQVSNHLREQVEETIKERWGWEIEELQTEWEGDDPEEMKVYLSLARFSPEENKSDIEPVNIQVEETEELDDKEEISAIEQDIYSYLTQTWEVDEEQIHITTAKEGG
ncbi:stage III sporulation protein AF [Alteribacillus sp. YIM 98480]|uniref:stage III sporulation protein AF n=1 Tax=Alteribacillus sp. YIM 98480 TaxID=2606599 RepID=UPI00131AEDC3|nr:stage III sporulation protein AF [Alteribacillus sp. YIM 98480]